MAIKTLYAIKDFRYGTRMMRAGDPVDMDASHQRLYSALGAVTAEKPLRKVAPPIGNATEPRTAANTPREGPTAKPKAASKRKRPAKPKK